MPSVNLPYKELERGGPLPAAYLLAVLLAVRIRLSGYKLLCALAGALKKLVSLH